jgi:hypothetical protein
MQWYYKDKADGSRHGVAEEPALFEMARKGELKPGDLVCSEQTGTRWVPASTIKGLFDKPVEATAPAQAAPAPQSVKSKRPEKDRKKIPVNAVVMGAIAICAAAAVIYYLKSHSTIEEFLPKADGQSPPTSTPWPEIPTDVTPTPVSQEGTADNTDTNVPSPAASIIEQMNKCMAEEDTDKASKLLMELAQSSEETLVVRAMSKKLSLLKQTLLRVKQCENALRKGELGPDGIRELVAYYESRKRTADLLKITAGILSNSNTLTTETSLGVARLSTILKEYGQTKIALDNYVSTVKVSKNVKEYIEVARMFNTVNDPLRGATLLNNYLERESTDSTVWFEFAALKCAGGDSDSAIEALKKAIKYGYEDVKEKARQDNRFAPIKEQRAFKKLIGSK